MSAKETLRKNWEAAQARAAENKARQRAATAPAKPVFYCSELACYMTSHNRHDLVRCDPPE